MLPTTKVPEYDTLDAIKQDQDHAKIDAHRDGLSRRRSQDLMLSIPSIRNQQGDCKRVNRQRIAITGSIMADFALAIRAPIRIAAGRVDVNSEFPG